MMEIRPSRRVGRAVGLALIAGLAVVDFLLLLHLLTQPISLLSFLAGVLLLATVPAITMIAYLTACLSAARYSVEEMVLIVQWGQFRQAIRLDQIRAITFGEAYAGFNKFRGFRWPGHMLGRGRVLDTDQKPLETTFFATGSLKHQLLIESDDMAYALSPPDPEEFKFNLETLMQLESSQQGSLPPPEIGFLGWPIWRDRAAQICLGASVILNAGLFAYLTAIYSRLPAEVVLHFNHQGVADRYGAPAGLLLLPFIGLLTWIGATLLGWLFHQIRNERPVAYVLWGGAVIVELATWVAVDGLLRGN